MAILDPIRRYKKNQEKNISKSGVMFGNLSDFPKGVDFSSKFDINIIYQNDDFIIIDKPAGLLVHPIKSLKFKVKGSKLNEFTLTDWLLERYPEIRDVGAEPQIRPGIVHRLDKEVSGLMVVAKTNVAYEHLVQQFKENKIRKEYLALVYGQPEQDKGLIDLPIGRTKKGKIVVVKYRKGIKLEKPAVTEYEIIQKYPASPKKGRQASGFTLLKVKPLTGRTHQIRVHLKSIGCPIVGDEKYRFKIKDSRLKIDRIFLHASYLGFYDLKGQWREFRTDLPIELQEFLNNLK